MVGAVFVVGVDFLAVAVAANAVSYEESNGLHEG